MPVERPWDFEQQRNDLALPNSESFHAGRRRRFGQTNPELMRVPFWDYMVRSGRDPFYLREEYGVEENSCSPDSRETSAIWSFPRIGKTTTLYKDRFLISIGGEYDDWYDPDFLIYNDVIVRNNSGDVWIYGYPKDVFPPTDFHTATLLEDDWRCHLQLPDDLIGGIIIIGGLGYAEDREFWRTPVYRLDLGEMYIHSLKCSGDEPGWIHKHTAALTSRSQIYVEGGKILTQTGDFIPNEDEFFLDLATLHWTKRITSLEAA